MARIDGGEHRLLTPGVRAVYTPGFLIHVSADGGLFATPFDPGRLETTGPSIPIASDVNVRLMGTLNLAVSNDGSLVYGATGVRARSELVLVSRQGATIPVDPDFTDEFQSVRASGDGSQIALQVRDGDPDVWVRSLTRGTTVQITTDGGSFRPTWSPDGEQVLFTRASGLDFDLWAARADGSGQPVVMLDRPRGIAEHQWTGDGRTLLYRADGGDIWSYDLERDDDIPVVTSREMETTPTLSADGDRIAFASDESGTWEVFVAPFPEANRAQRKVSEGGGTQPAWARSSNELFYRDRDDNLVVVEFDEGDGLSFSRPRPLFSAAAYLRNPFYRTYDVMPGDSTFLMIRVLGTGEPSELVVIDGLAELLGG